MRTIDYSEILAGSAGPAGLKYPDDLGVAELSAYRLAHDRHLQVAWEIEAWPDLCPTEKRYFRPKWNSATTYAATSVASPVERFDVASLAFYQSLQAGNLNNPPTIAGAQNSAWWAACQAQYSGADWASGQTYAVGTIVRNPGDNEFYQCISAHVSGGSFDGSKFAILVPFVRRIDYTQVEDDGTAYTVIGEYLRATDRNPKVTTKVTEIPFELDDSGAVFVTFSGHVSTSAGAQPFLWLKFRKRRPQLTGEPWDAGTVYTSGRQVYFRDETTNVANFYVANTTTAAGESPGTPPSKWDVVEIPYIFGGYLKEAGAAEWLFADGQDDKAALHLKLAVGDTDTPGYLQLEADKLWRQQGQSGRLNMVR